MKLSHLLLACACTYVSVSAQTAQPSPSDNEGFFWQHAESQPLAFDLSLGTLSGTTHAYSLDDDTKVSQLNWEMKNVPIAKAGVTWKITPWTALQVSGWTNIQTGNGQMNDYDWLPNEKTQVIEHYHSYHPKTDVQGTHHWDVAMRQWLFQSPEWQLGVTGGYEYNQFRWTAFGGEFHYPEGQSSLPNNVPSIAFRHTSKAPYVGVVAGYSGNNFRVQAQVKFSDWVRTTNFDNHYRRETIFEDSSRGSRLYGFSVSGEYALTKQLALTAELYWSRLTRSVGDTIMANFEEGSLSYEPETAAIENRYRTATIGLRYQF